MTARREKICHPKSINRLFFLFQRTNLLLQHHVIDCRQEQHIKDELPFNRLIVKGEMKWRSEQRKSEEVFCLVIELYCFVIVEWVLIWGNKIITGIDSAWNDSPLLPMHLRCIFRCEFCSFFLFNLARLISSPLVDRWNFWYLWKFN